MRNAIFYKLSLFLFVSALCLPHSYAQDSQQWGLPEWAKARLGKGGINDIQYSPDATRLAVASSIGIWLYDTTTHQEVALLAGHTGSVRSVAYSPDGRVIASGSGDATIRLWDADTGKHLRTLEGHERIVYSVAFSPDEGIIVSGSWDDTIRLWDPDTGKSLRTLTGHTAAVESLAFGPNGRTLASGGWDRTIRLWDTDTWTLLAELKGHTTTIRSVAFNLDGSTLASAGADGTVMLWELTSSTGVGVGVEPLGSLLTTLGNIKRTALLQNYPNPFNPDTWIPYQLAKDTLVTLSIYDQSGHIVRTLDIGHQVSGVYRDKTRAAYWDGRNQNGESVTSGTYYYQLRAGDYTALRRMVIVK